MTDAPFRLTLALPDADATAAFAERLGPVLGPGDVLLLKGQIGAGKTHFARALIQSRLSRHEDVPSPTFTLVQTYEAGDLEIWHADLYRLTHPDEVLELGLEDAFRSAICLVEWPDRLGDLVPADALHLHFALAGEDARHLTLAAAERWASRLASLHLSEIPLE